MARVGTLRRWPCWRTARRTRHIRHSCRSIAPSHMKRWSGSEQQKQKYAILQKSTSSLTSLSHLRLHVTENITIERVINADGRGSGPRRRIPRLPPRLHPSAGHSNSGRTHQSQLPPYQINMSTYLVIVLRLLQELVERDLLTHGGSVVKYLAFALRGEK